MKLIKFRDYLVPLILSGEKNSTWRLYDDKNLSVGDDIQLQEFGKEKPFAEARITKVIEKALGDLSDDDKQGHEKFASDKDMYERFSTYYNSQVDESTTVKIIWFDLLKQY